MFDEQKIKSFKLKNCKHQTHANIKLSCMEAKFPHTNKNTTQIYRNYIFMSIS